MGFQVASSPPRRLGLTPGVALRLPQTPPPRASSAALHRLPRVAATLRRLGRQPPRRLCDAIGISTVNVDDQVYFHKIPDEVLESLVSLRAATVDPLFCSSIVAY